MAALRNFEIEAIRILARDALTPEQLSRLEEIPAASAYEYTGCGYFLTLADPCLPAEEAILMYPDVAGEHGDVTCGFVVFLGAHELVLECHPWDFSDVPEHIRDLPVRVFARPTVNM